MTAIVAALLAAACHRDAGTMQREQKSYDVVQEGQASGVSSTISAPGETTPPVTNTMTSTSADTTSNFTLAPNVDTTGTLPPGSLAGTFPSSSAPMPPLPRTSTMVPRPQRQQQPPQPRPVIIIRTSPRPAPPPPQQTDTSATEEPPPSDQQPTPPPPPPTTTDTRG